MAIEADTSLANSELRAPWAPLVCIFMTQVLMSFNASALPVSIGGLVEEFNIAPTTAGTVIVVYGLVVAALVMVGAKLGQRMGWVPIFRVAVVLFAIAQTVMVLAPSINWVIAAQALAGACAANLVPSLVALIAENYRGPQQATAVGALGSARAISGVSAFLIGGALGTLIGWRPVFMLLILMALGVFLLSFRLRSDKGDPSVRIDLVGAVLIGVGIVLLSLGFNNLNSWGLFLADSGAPFSILGLSPALLFILVGVILGQAFFVWTGRRTRQGKVPLVSLSVLGSSRERAAIYAMFIIVALEGALNFTVPLYIQIVQGRTPLDTAISMMPFNLTVFITATLIVRFYRRFSPRVIGLFSFCLCTAALIWLAFVVTNDWQTLPTIIGLVCFGIGQGALVTLVFNVLVTAVPKELAGDVGSLRGTTQNLASAVGTAVAGALLVNILSLNVMRAVAANVKIPDEIIAQVDLDQVNFVGNDQLRATLETVGATEPQIDAAVQINTRARLNALKLGLLILAGISALATIPASRLPRYTPGEIPAPLPRE